LGERSRAGEHQADDYQGQGKDDFFHAQLLVRRIADIFALIIARTALNGT
jgi:hypothetical protein